jgi:hypothetical protein
MTDDRSLERAARSWLEEGPTRAPEQPVQAAIARIQTTGQVWAPTNALNRFITNPVVQLAGVAAVAVLVVALALLAARPTPRVGPATTPTPPPSASPHGSASVRPIPNGVFRAPPIPVSDILERLAADTTLTSDQKTAVIRDILEIDGAATLHVEISIRDATFTLGYASDGPPLSAEPAWDLYVLDATRISLRPGPDTAAFQAYEVTRVGEGFSLRALSPAPDPVQAFVRSVLFETVSFAPIP